jgi:glutathione S-transferase
MMDAAVLIRLEGVLREAEHRSESWVARQRKKIDDGLVAMAQELGSKKWCAGNHYTIADIALGCALSYLEFRMPELDWRTQHPNLDKHFQKLSQRASFADTVLVAS